MSLPEVEPRLPRPYATYALLAAIAAVYVWVETHGGSQDPAVLHRFGALYPPDVIARGESWRLLTAIFLHQGLVHVGLNSYVLLFMGRLVETVFGTGRFLLVYLAAGLAGTMASLAFGSLVGSVGASGAIFGLFGAMVYWRTVDRRARRVPWRSLLGPIAVNLSIGLVVPNVDNWGHAGGLVGGAVAAALIGLPRRTPTWRLPAGRRLAAGALALLIVALTAGWLPLPVDPARADWARGIAALDDEQPVAAEGWLRAAAGRWPGNADLRADWAASLYYTGDFGAAREQALAALELDPGNRQARQVLRAIPAGSGS